jgi:hypothetical protein
MLDTSGIDDVLSTMEINKLTIMVFTCFISMLYSILNITGNIIL